MTKRFTFTCTDTMGGASTSGHPDSTRTFVG